MRLRDRVVVGISGYQDYKGLKQLLDQITPHVYKVVYGDGKYDFFSLKSTNDSFFSTDGSIELCKQYDNVEVITFTGYQVAKRQKIADKAVELGARVYIIIDTDEWIHPDFQNWDLFYDKLEADIEKYGRFHRVWNLMIYVEEDYELALNAVHRDSWSVGAGRIWYRPEELEYYANVHYFVRRRDTDDPHERLMSTEKTISEGIRLITSSKHRDKEFKISREKWAKDTIDHEQQFINAYNWAIEHGKKFVAKAQVMKVDLYPLLVIMGNKQNETRENGIIQQNKHADVIFLKHGRDNDDGLTALSKILDYFRGHAGYTHLVLSSFDINWTLKDYKMLYQEVKDMDHTVLSGYVMNPVKHNGDGTFHAPERANFTLPNAKTISKNELHSKPTSLDISNYIRMFRQYVIPIENINTFPLMFIRNDVVRYLDDYDVRIARANELTPIQALMTRLDKLGIMRYVHLGCRLDQISIDSFDDVRTGYRYNIEFHEGKYEKITI